MAMVPAPDQIREIRCPNCGSQHPNPALCETYRYCARCFCVIRATDAIDISHLPKPKGPLLIIAASYGHSADASKAIDVRAILQNRVEAYGAKDRLHIKEIDHLLEVSFSERAKLWDPPKTRQDNNTHYIIPLRLARLCSKFSREWWLPVLES